VLRDCKGAHSLAFVPVCQRYKYFSSSVPCFQIPNSLRDFTQAVTLVDDRREIFGRSNSKYIQRAEELGVMRTCLWIFPCSTKLTTPAIAGAFSFASLGSSTLSTSSRPARSIHSVLHSARKGDKIN
jgi:hypothetical protein